MTTTTAQPTDRRRCPKGCGTQTVVDQFIEADHGLPGAQEWGVLELACGHYLEGDPHPVALCLEANSVGLDIPGSWVTAFAAATPF